jgi:small-conductance mechanosensitive channel
MAIIEEEAVKHPLFVDIRTEEEIEEGKPKLDIFCRNLSSSGMMIRAYISAADSRKSFEYLMDMNKLIKLRFDQEGIEIALPYMNVVMRDPGTHGGRSFDNEGIEKPGV